MSRRGQGRGRSNADGRTGPDDTPAKLSIQTLNSGLPDYEDMGMMGAMGNNPAPRGGPRNMRDSVKPTATKIPTTISRASGPTGRNPGQLPPLAPLTPERSIPDIELTPSTGSSKASIQGSKPIKATLGSLSSKPTGGKSGNGKSYTRKTNGDKKGANNNKIPPQIQKKKHAALPAISTTQRILAGNLENLPPQRSSVVRIFISSTFTDMKAERNTFVKKVYPVMKDFCASIGLDFQVMDMRWGVTDFATNDHSTTSLCLKEIENCRRLSRGPCFVVLVGNKYGFRPLVPNIEVSEFEALLSVAENKDIKGKDELRKWYIKDDNAQPPQYILQPIDTHLKFYADMAEENAEKRKADCAQWKSTLDQLHCCLSECASAALQASLLTKEQVQKYTTSVTEQEIEIGLFKNENAQTTCSYFGRDLKDLKDRLADNQAVRFTDVVHCNDKIKLNQDLQHKLDQLDQSVKGSLTTDTVRNYQIPWVEGGVQTENNKEHEEYLDKLCDDMINTLKAQIETFSKTEEREILKEIKHGHYTQTTTPKPHTEVKLPRGREHAFTAHMGANMFDFMVGDMSAKKIISELKELEEDENDDNTSISTIDKSRIEIHSEILHHLYFCKAKCEVFCGRENETETVKAYLKKITKTKPLVISGASGCGKTSYLASIAERSKEWLGKNTVVIIRFMGTSPQSTSIKSLLTSVCKHICFAYNEYLNLHALKKMGTLVKYMQELLWFVAVKHAHHRPLCIILDGVDQLSKKDGAHSMQWLPHSCPSNVHMIVSLLPDMYNCLENAKAHLQDEKCILTLGTMTNETGEKLIRKYLAHRNRTVNKDQFELLMKTFEKNQNALYMKLVLDEACQWASYDDCDQIQLEHSISSLIDHFFKQLERKYGNILVQHALGYLTVGRNGLTEVEIEDVLSMNDDVLSEVYRYHNPPVHTVVRIPHLIWSRIRHDLKDYVAERKTFKKVTISWYHRQFMEAAIRMYASGNQCKQRHSELGDLYLCEKPYKKTITLKQRNFTAEDADRQITMQPMVDTNLRKIVSLPYHLMQAGDVARLKNKVFCDLKYIQCRMSAFSCLEYLEELKGTVRDTQDEELKLLQGCLQFTTNQLQNDMSALPAQILGQLLKYCDTHLNLKQLCDQAKESFQKEKTIAIEPTFACFPTSSGPLIWYAEETRNIVVFSQDRTMCLLQCENPGEEEKQSKLYVLNMSNLVMVCSLSKQEKGVVVQAWFGSTGERVFVLYTTGFSIYSTKSGNAVDSGPLDNYDNKAVNQCMALSSHDTYIAVGGIGKISVLQDSSASYDDPHFKPRMSMNISGVLATSNIIFTKDDAHTIATHCIKGKTGKIGAITLWDFIGNQIKSKVALPTPVQKGFIREIEEKTVMCGCINHTISMVDLSTSNIVQQFGNPVKSPENSLIWDIFKVNSFIIQGVSGDNKLNIWNYNTGKLENTITHSTGVRSFHLSADGQKIGIGDANGDVTIRSLGKKSEDVSQKAHTGAVEFLRIQDDNTILSRGEDCMLRLWNMEKITGSNNNNNAEETKNTTESHLESMDVTAFDISNDGQFIITASTKGVTLLEFPALKIVAISSVKRSDRIIASKGMIFSLDKEENQLSLLTLNEKSLEIQKTLEAKEICINKEKSHVYVIDNQAENYMVKKLDTSSGDVLSQNSWNMDVSSPFNFSVTLEENFLIFCTRSLSNPRGFIVHGVNITKEKSDYRTCKSDNQIKNVFAQDKIVYSYQSTGKDQVLLGGDGDIQIWNPSEVKSVVPTKSGSLIWMNHGARLEWRKGNNKKSNGSTSRDIRVTSLTEGKVLVSGANDGSIIIWKDVESTPEEQAILIKKHTRKVTSLDISPSGHLLVSGSRDKTVRLYGMKQGKQVSSIHVHADVTHVQFVKEDLIVVLASHMDISRIMLFYIRNLT